MNFGMGLDFLLPLLLIQNIDQGFVTVEADLNDLRDPISLTETEKKYSFLHESVFIRVSARVCERNRERLPFLTRGIRIDGGVIPCVCVCVCVSVSLHEPPTLYRFTFPHS